MNMTILGIVQDEYEISKVIRNFKDTYPISQWKKIGLFDEDFLETINIHWLKYSPPHPTNHYVLAALYVVIMSVGCCGNAFVIFMFLRCLSLRTPANTLIMNLAISDLLMMSKLPIFIFNSIHLGPALGKIGCHIFGFVGGLSGTVSICTLAAISLDRYYVIKFPLNMRFTKLRAKICVVISWCYSAIFSGIPLLHLNFGSYTPEGYLTSCSFDYLSQKLEVKLFIFIFFVAAWVIPFLLITFCYVNIIKTVIGTRNVTRKDSESSRHMKIEAKRQQEFKLALTILFIVVLWFAAWTPYSVVALLGISNRADLIPPIASMIPALFCKTAACIDPFVYAITNQKFKNEVRKLFTRKAKIRGSPRIWITQTTLTKKEKVKPKLKRLHSCQASYEVEDEIITLDNVESVQERKVYPSSSKKQEEIVVQNDMELIARNVETETRGSVRIWTTQSTLSKKEITKPKPFRMHFCQVSDEVESEIISLDNVKSIQGGKTLLSSKEEEQIAVQKDIEKSTRNKFKPRWWYRPSFSNRNSSLRGIARNLKQLEKRKSVSCDYCDESH